MDPSQADLSKVPALLVDWTDPNFINPKERRYLGYVVCSICMGIAIAITLARLWVKVRIGTPSRLADVLSLLGFLVIAAYYAILFVITQSGYTRHLWDFPILWVPRFQELVNVACILWIVALLLLKLVILLQYLEVFATRKLKRGIVFWTIHLFIWIYTFCYVAFMFLLIFQCVPRKKISYSLAPGKCIDKYNLLVASSIFNAAVDLSLVLLPIWAIWLLQLSIKRKFILSGVFLTGILSCAVCFIRIVYCIQLKNTKDKSWKTSEVAMWGMVELVGLYFCGSLVVLPQVFSLLQEKSKWITKPENLGMHKPKTSLSRTALTSNTTENESLIPGLPSNVNQVAIIAVKSDESDLEADNAGFFALPAPVHHGPPGIMKTVDMELSIHNYPDDDRF